MTPLEMTDWLDSLAETDLNAGTLSAAAAMLREAERLLANPYLADWVPESWLQETTDWLEGRTP